MTGNIGYVITHCCQGEDHAGVLCGFSRIQPLFFVDMGKNVLNNIFVITIGYLTIISLSGIHRSSFRTNKR